MSAWEQPRERLEELLIDRAVFGLQAAEEAELKALLLAFPEATQQAEWDGLAAEVWKEALLTGVAAGADELPPTLRARLAEDARSFFDIESKPPSSPARDASASKTRAVTAPLPNVTAPSASVSVKGREILAWLLAAAAIAIAAILYGGNAAPQSSNYAQQRDTLIAQAEDRLVVSWQLSEDPSAEQATGDVVWSNARQEGYLKIRNLRPNNPSVEQYQLWIIDGERDAAQPVDGGVFDIPVGAGEVVIPIDAKLRVFDPQAFAVTIEQPGGVVVSKRTRLPLLAPVGEE